MVWTVWVGPGMLAELVGIWPSEAEARGQCEAIAAKHAAGSGLITESMMGDAWDAVSPSKVSLHVCFIPAAFGPFDS